MPLSDEDLNLPSVPQALATADAFKTQLANGDTLKPALVGKGVKELIALSVAYRDLLTRIGTDTESGAEG